MGPPVARAAVCSLAVVLFFFYLLFNVFGNYNL